MKTNTKNKFEEKTYEGARAIRLTPKQQLNRAVMATLLWEKQFYEDGVDINKRIAELVPKVSPEAVRDIAIAARNESKLRHMPLFIVKEMAKHPEHKKYVAEVLTAVIQRADELAEFLALYWKEGKCPISAQVKKGLAAAFTKFNEYQLAKYNRDNAIKLRDVLFMVHAKPKDKDQEKLWKKLVDGELTIPDTWEVALSAGANKKETFERLMGERKLGALATLRNIRNMVEAGIDRNVIRNYVFTMPVERVLPFRFISAARFAPWLEPVLEQSMFKCLEGFSRLKGETVFLVDVSGSMDSQISTKSDITRLDAACGVTMLGREICDNARVFTFSYNHVEVPARRGFALRDAIVKSQSHGVTWLGKAIDYINNNVKYDRLVVITDEQSSDSVGAPKGKGYIINVASYTSGVGYGNWVRIDGWSESVINYITEYEKLEGSNEVCD